MGTCASFCKKIGTGKFKKDKSSQKTQNSGSFCLSSVENRVFKAENHFVDGEILKKIEMFNLSSNSTRSFAIKTENEKIIEKRDTSTKTILDIQDEPNSFYSNKLRNSLGCCSNRTTRDQSTSAGLQVRVSNTSNNLKDHPKRLTEIQRDSLQGNDAPSPLDLRFQPIPNVYFGQSDMKANLETKNGPRVESSSSSSGKSSASSSSSSMDSSISEKGIEELEKEKNNIVMYVDKNGQKSDKSTDRILSQTLYEIIMEESGIIVKIPVLSADISNSSIMIKRRIKCTIGPQEASTSNF